MVDSKTFNELRDKLSQSVSKKYGEQAWVNEIFIHKREIIYEKENRLFAVKYQEDEKAGIVFGESSEVTKSVTYPSVRNG